MDIKKSKLYGALKLNQRCNSFKHISECNFLIQGYSIALDPSTKSIIPFEYWISDLHKFIEYQLKEMFYPNEDSLLNANFAEVLKLHIQDEKERLKIFFDLLDEFVEIYSKEE